MTKTSINTLINKAGIIRLTSGITIVFYGVRVEDNNFIYYTAKGIREIVIGRSRKKFENESQMLKSEHMACIPCEKITELVSLNGLISK